MYKDPFINEAIELVKNVPRVTSCVCCGSTNVIKSNMRMAGFVVERMLNTVMLDSILDLAIQCQDCYFISSALRFTDEQIRHYYHEYMDANSSEGRQHGSYVFHRLRNEGTGWFDLVKLYKQPWWIEARKEAIVNVIKSKDIWLKDIKSVLDFGGDLGQYIPDEFDHARRHVVEIEERELVEGVTAVSSPDKCDPVDLVLCCHTLEHVSYPSDLVAEMKRYLRPGGLLYIEVPDEEESTLKSIRESKAIEMHEHINIFWPDSLRALIERNGFETMAIGRIPYDDVHKDLEPARAILARLL
jgi:SAM-dependent methyltransferase